MYVFYSQGNVSPWSRVFLHVFYLLGVERVEGGSGVGGVGGGGAGMSCDTADFESLFSCSVIKQGCFPPVLVIRSHPFHTIYAFLCRDGPYRP